MWGKAVCRPSQPPRSPRTFFSPPSPSAWGCVRCYQRYMLRVLILSFRRENLFLRVPVPSLCSQQQQRQQLTLQLVVVIVVEK